MLISSRPVGYHRRRLNGTCRQAECEAMSDSLPEIYLARHGETAWTISRQHTGRTDIPLTEQGERNARSLGERLRDTAFARIVSSPLQRAWRTCELAGFASDNPGDPELAEWDYGAYEGLTTAEIRARRPGWDLFRDGCPGGESVQAVGDRADRVIARLRTAQGRTLVFGHSHFFRVLAARWLGLPPGDARYFLLGTAALSIVGVEHSREEPVIRLWNDDWHVRT
jgi:broad specificity phosphatase PhoE